MSENLHLRSWTPSRIIYGVVILAWIAAYAWLLVGDRYQTFLRADFVFLVIGGMIMLVLMMIPVLSVPDASGCCQHAGGKALAVHAALMILPLVYLLDAQGHALGAYAFEKRTIKQTYSESLTDEPYTGPGDATTAAPDESPTAEDVMHGTEPLEVTIADLYKLPDEYRGKPIVTVGMLFQDPEFLPPGRVVVFRFMMVCCAADVRPFEMLVAVKQPLALSNDTWVKVQGLLNYRMIDGIQTPFVSEATVEKTAPPKVQFLSY